MRRADWRERFRDAIDTASLVSFRYGQHDCCLFVAYVLDQMCDTNYVKQVKDAYGYVDELSAIDVLTSNGGLHKLVCDWLGPPVPRAQARSGDVVLLRLGDQVALGIVENHCALAAAKTGVESVPMKHVVAAWRID